jgi:hypothetical protein
VTPIAARTESGSRARSWPATCTLATICANERGQNLNRGGLAGAVGAEQREDRPLGNVEIDAIEHNPAAERPCAARLPRSPMGVWSRPLLLLSWESVHAARLAAVSPRFQMPAPIIRREMWYLATRDLKGRVPASTLLRSAGCHRRHNDSAIAGLGALLAGLRSAGRHRRHNDSAIAGLGTLLAGLRSAGCHRRHNRSAIARSGVR